MNLGLLPTVALTLLQHLTGGTSPSIPHKGVDSLPVKLGTESLGHNLPPKQQESRLGVRWVREEQCRQLLEELCRLPFPKTRKIIKSPDTGRWLELDGYNAKLKIAFEHNGAQHYTFPNTFHHSLKQFWRQVRNDQIKKVECHRQGILLIIIRQDDKDLRSTIIKQLTPEVKKRILRHRRLLETQT